MGDKSKIEWTESTWNTITGCSPVSEGCANCYAKREAEGRLRGKFGYPQDEPFRVTFHGEDRLNDPLRWKRPRKIFVCSMGDLFHEDVPFVWIDKVFQVMSECKQHRFMLLTKRPERMKSYFLGFRDEAEEKAEQEIRSKPFWLRLECDLYRNANAQFRRQPLANVWLGVTAENQERADERIPVLLQIPAAKHFVSVEPMLGHIDLVKYLQKGTEFHLSLNVEGALRNRSFDGLFADNGKEMTREEAKEHLERLAALGIKRVASSECDNFDHQRGCQDHEKTTLDWVICGGETGANARPLHPDWVRSLRDQCQEAQVPFFFKSWGEWKFICEVIIPEYDKADYPEYWRRPGEKPMFAFPDGTTLERLGRRQTGRELDGRTWDEEPA